MVRVKVCYANKCHEGCVTIYKPTAEVTGFSIFIVDNEDDVFATCPTTKTKAEGKVLEIEI